MWEAGYEAADAGGRSEDAMSGAPVTPYNPIPGRRALAKPPRVSPAPAVNQSVDTKNLKPKQSRWHLIEVK